MDPEIMKIGAQPFMYMRTDAFAQKNFESERIITDLLHCKGGRTIIYTASGTGAMGAVVENYASTLGKAFVLDGGSFGHRWYELCEYYGVPMVHYKVDFGKNPDYADMESKVAAERPGVFLCQHHETSSGELYDLAKIGDICRRYGVSLVVDGISSFLAEPLNMDESGVDICILSSQKGLNIPPGLAILVFSERILGHKFAHKGFYWDFDFNLGNMKRGQTAFSPATQIFLQLNARLRQIEAEGGEEHNFGLVKRRCGYFRSLCAEYGWKVIAENPSNAITGFQTADKGRNVFQGLIDKYDTYIMPGVITGFYRISHTGLQSDEELRLLAERIREFE